MKKKPLAELRMWALVIAGEDISADNFYSSREEARRAKSYVQFRARVQQEEAPAMTIKRVLVTVREVE